MNVAQMRVELAKKYGNKFAARMKDDQVIAIYKNLKSKNKI